MINDISLDLYKIFCTVVRLGNMSAAAKELYISQPAVSMSIKQLEEKLGSNLLVRTPKGVRTTSEGEVLYSYLEQALNLIKKAEHKYSEMINLEAGEIKIGANDTIISNYLLPYLERYNSENPSINIKVTNKTTYESLKLLRNGSVDICFVNLPIKEDEDLEIFECIKIHDCLIGGSKYKELASKGVNIKNINEYPLLLLERMSNSRCYLDSYATEHGVVLKPIIELGSSDLIIDFVRINLGVGFTIKEFSLPHIDRKSIFEIPLLPAPKVRSVGLAKLKNVSLCNAAQKFVEPFIK